MEEFNAESDQNIDRTFNIVDVFDLPKFDYDKERKKFMKNTQPNCSLFGTAEQKTELFRSRFSIIQQRTLRHDLFSPSALGGGGSGDKKYKLQPIEFLLGSSSKLGDIIVLGKDNRKCKVNIRFRVRNILLTF